MITPIVSNPGLTGRGYKNIFRFTNSDDQTAAAIAFHLFAKFGKRSAAIVGTTTTDGASMSTEFIKAFQSSGRRIVQEHWVEEGTKDFDGFAKSVRGVVDVIFYGGTFEGAHLLQALRAHDVPQLLATGDGCWDVTNFIEPASAVVELSEGVLVLSAAPEIGCVTGLVTSQRVMRRFTARSRTMRSIPMMPDEF